MTTVQRYDRVELKATRNDQGAIIDSPVLTRTGVFPYRQPDGSIRREYRPPEAVFHADSLARFKGLPITDGHPGQVNSKNVRPHLLGTVISPGRQDGGTNLVADVVINATGPVDDNGSKELSVGYTVELVEQSGTTPEGEKYDAIQSQILPNHVAVVPKGRAGNARLNLDSIDDEEGNPAMPQLRLDNGLSYEVPPEVAVAYAARSDELTLAKAAIDSEKARADAEKARADKAESDKAEAVKAAGAAARDRVELEAKAKAHGVEVKADQTDAQVRAAVLGKLAPELKLDGKDDAYVSAALDMAIAAASKADDNARKQADASGSTRNDGADKLTSSADARQSMMTANQGA